MFSKYDRSAHSMEILKACFALFSKFKLNNQSKMTSICHIEKDLHYLYEYQNYSKKPSSTEMQFLVL